VVRALASNEHRVDNFAHLVKLSIFTVDFFVIYDLLIFLLVDCKHGFECALIFIFFRFGVLFKIISNRPLSNLENETLEENL